MFVFLLIACGVDTNDDGFDPLACECDPIDTSTSSETTDTSDSSAPCDTAHGDTGCDTGTTAGT